jgi:DNA modification methylase
MPADFINRIHQGDCVAGLNALPAETVDLAFADPPFNIGYKYDVYDDRREREHYLDWSRQWIAAVYRALKPNGTFWLAIGDEYAAELKVMSQDIGFHTRSWVVWYYTFGVNCKNKFTRSHAHLFYFVKNKEAFTFRGDAPENRIPSARQLVYNDSRANPKGRLPDDTWILRPQDMADCFQADEDTWYFPRVAGTFKERAGFHGCQMPEQLLGRIIRSCSNEGDLVLDPFSGSATTLVTAKKLGRDYLGFELSPDYAERGAQRVEDAVVGAPLVGSADPTRSAPRTPGLAHHEAEAVPEAASVREPEPIAENVPEPVAEFVIEAMSDVVEVSSEPSPSGELEAEAVSSDVADETIVAASPVETVCESASESEAAAPNSDVALEEVVAELVPIAEEAETVAVEESPGVAAVAEPHDPNRELVEAFRRACGGYSADRVMADPKLQAAFITHCQGLKVPGEPRTWNASLFRLRKAGKLKNVPTTLTTELAWPEAEPFAFAAEIALAKLSAAHPHVGLDELLCDPVLAAEFDKLTAKFGGSKKAFEYRWTALKLRKEAKQLRDRAQELRKLEPSFETPIRIAGKRWDKSIPQAGGLYLILNSAGDRIYIGATSSLRARLAKQLAAARLASYDRSGDIRVAVWPLDRPFTDLLALQQRLIAQSRPQLNEYRAEQAAPASTEPNREARKKPHRRADKLLATGR